MHKMHKKAFTRWSLLMVILFVISALLLGSASASLFYKVELTATETSSEVELGKSSVYTLTVKNTGLFPDDVYIDYTAPPEGWSAILDTSVIKNLGAGESQEVRATITSSSQTKVTKATIRVSAISGHDPAEQSAVNLITTVNLPPSPEEPSVFEEWKIYFVFFAVLIAIIGIPFSLRSRDQLELECKENEKTISKGESAVYNVAVHNLANKPVEGVFVMGAIPKDWSALLEAPSMILRAKESKIFTVMVIPSQDSAHNERRMIGIAVYNKNKPEKKSAITLITNVQ